MNIKRMKYLAESGDLDAIKNLAYGYAVGENVAADHKEAIHWYEKAANMDDHDSLYHLGLMHLFGEGTVVNEGIGIGLLFRASKFMNNDATLCLADAYIKGLWGLNVDYNLALEYSLKAAFFGNLRGMRYAGDLLRAGNVSKDRMIDVMVNFGDDL